jgi:hypothetical protein
VGRTFLDGAINPASNAGETSNSQLLGFENSLRAWATDCVTQGACTALGATADDVLAVVRAMIKGCETNPLPTYTPSRKVTPTLAFTGVILALYDSGYWPLLTLAVSNAVLANDGSMLLMLADAYNSFDGAQYSSNMLQANTAINCLDYPSADATRESTQAAIDQAILTAPTLGEFWMSNGISQCAHWPYEAKIKPRAVKSTTKSKILIIGTTGDPATPYTNAIELDKQLRTARLLTYQGQGHTAYGRGNACVNKVVDRYLLTGKLPRKGRVCY